MILMILKQQIIQKDKNLLVLQNVKSEILFVLQLNQFQELLLIESQIEKEMDYYILEEQNMIWVEIQYYSKLDVNNLQQKLKYF